MKRKAQLNSVVLAIITLIVGVSVATLVMIFTGTLAGQTYQLTESKINAIGSNAASGDSFTPLNSTAVSLDHAYIHVGTLVVSNASGVVGLGNFTVDYTTGTVTLKTIGYNNTAFTATYTYGNTAVREAVKASMLAGFNTQRQTSEYMPLIVLAVVISMILGLVLGMTSLQGKSGGGMAL